LKRPYNAGYVSKEACKGLTVWMGECKKFPVKVKQEATEEREREWLC